jgi:hypothetical protein
MANQFEVPDADLQRMVDLCQTMHQTEAAIELGIARTTLQSRMRIAKQRGITPNAKKVENRKDTEIRGLKDKVLELERQLKSAHRDVLATEAIRGFFSLAQDRAPSFPEWVVKPAKTTGQLGTPLALWSDWHLGEVVKPEQVAYINQYDLKIAEKRVRTLVEKIIYLSFDFAKKPDYPGIVVALGGDIISGFIHQELRETNEGTIAEQLLAAYRIVGSALLTLAGRFGRVFVTGVVGNHGRLTFKPQAKNRVVENLEWALYSLLEERFNPVDPATGKKLAGYDERFAFYISQDTDALFTVAGHRFLLTHGDSTGARGGDGIIGAIGPIVRGEKKVRDVQSMIEMNYDTALMGHYHTFVQLHNVIVNPTLKGYDEFVKNMMRARPEPPAQLLLFVHPDYGIIDTKRIFVETVRREGRTSDFVTIPGVRR